MNAFPFPPWSGADGQHQVAALGSCPRQMPYLTAKSWQALSRNMCFLWRATVSRWDPQTALLSPASCVVIWAAFLVGTLGPEHGIFSGLCWKPFKCNYAVSLRNTWLRGSTQIEFWGQLEITLDLGALTKACLNPPAFSRGSSFFNHSLVFFWLGHWLIDDVNPPHPSFHNTVQNVLLFVLLGGCRDSKYEINFWTSTHWHF